MFQRILVPLDGTERAENALPIAASIARATGGLLLLLHVAPLLTLPEGTFQTEYQRTSTYLEEKKHAEILRGIPTATHVAAGPIAQQILSCIRSQNIDLVVMYHQGETDIKRWTWGSVARTVLRQSVAPVLVWRESKSNGIQCSPHFTRQHPLRLLVALDGSTQAEATLLPAAMLATALSIPERGELCLVRVVPLPEQSNTTASVSGGQQIEREDAQTYLRTREKSLQGREKLTTTTSVVVCSDIADALIRTAEGRSPVPEETGSKVSYDIIALATHGRSGRERWVMGSITERVLDGIRLPLLVIPPVMG